MIDEIDRVLSKGGRYITFSLHSIDETKHLYEKNSHSWRIKSYRIRSSRWNEKENCDKSIAHTMIICDKPLSDGSFPYDCDDELVGTISIDVESELTKQINLVKLKQCLKDMATEDLILCLDTAISAYISIQNWNDF